VSYAEIVSALDAGGGIARDDVRRWIDSGSLLTWSGVYALLETPGRIEPPLPPDEVLALARRYLVRCIEENPTPGEHLHGGYEAAWELAAVLRRWRREGGHAAAAIRSAALDLVRLYRSGDPAVKSRVLCGVLEHAFEDAALRKYFTHWERDEELREAFKLATEWGAAHPD
jgi:hypothetical protein